VHVRERARGEREVGGKRGRGKVIELEKESE